ncbi:uncharacterized protein LOC134819975 [Bolinopsis microptera]|uniref:uncharacterized protein LOC134819975 n=1 Tax=Bolinopsis microptera TaxID=2820187 RepID=UPI0030795CB3
MTRTVPTVPSTKPLECSFRDKLDSWNTFIASVMIQKNDEDLNLIFHPITKCDAIEPGFAVITGSPLEECVCIRNCVVGIRTPEHFMRSVLSSEVAQDCEGMYLIVTPAKIINCKGIGAEDLTRKILSQRFHQNTTLEIFYMCADSGEVDGDETEFLLAVTPSEVSVISLYRTCITRSLPFTKIRTYHRDSTYPNTILLEVGRMKDGNRTYSFRSERAGEFITALRDQIKQSRHQKVDESEDTRALSRVTVDLMIGLLKIFAAKLSFTPQQYVS